MTGLVAKANPIRFSTQYADDVRGDLKYFYRNYDAADGNWKSRDSIGERGGENLYGLVHNSPISYIDPLGLNAVFSLEVVRTFGIGGQLRDHYGQPAIALTYVEREILSHGSPRACGKNKVKVPSFIVYAKIRESFSMSFEDAQKLILYTLPNGKQEWQVPMAHEEGHANARARRYHQIYLGYLYIYNKCVCTGCYDQWVEYQKMLQFYSESMVSLEDAEMDCHLGNPAACDYLKIRIGGQARLEENMREHGARLVSACQCKTQ